MSWKRRTFFPLNSELALLVVAALAGALAGAAPAVAESPVVFALDSSRSLSTAESRATAELVKSLLTGVPAAATPGILTFDDEVRWLARPGAIAASGATGATGASGASGATGATGATEASAALDAMIPGGRFTVLNDGLIEGVRALDKGGVLVLLSDGRDENSATTLEDAARLASERGVRLVTVASGRADERTLRRLALLTGGLYAGPVGKLDSAALLQGIEALRRDVASERLARAPAAPAREPARPPSAIAAETDATAVPGSGVEVAAPASGWPSSRGLLAVGAAVAALGIVLGFLLARRRSASPAAESRELERGTQPGVHWPEATPAATPVATTSLLAASPPAVSPFPAPQPIDEVQIARVRLRPSIRPQGLMEISLDETAEFQRLPFSESIERTLVLTAEVVLTVREPGREPRSYRLPPDRAVDIGRDAAQNTLSFQDPTMSTQHLRVVLDDDELYLVDLGSTNGVLVGERRVDAVHLHPGDRFRAGMIEFEIGLHHASTGRVESA